MIAHTEKIGAAGTYKAAFGSIHYWAMSTTAPTAAVSPSRGYCARATPGPTLSPTTKLPAGLANASPKTLRYRLLHTAARLIDHARRLEIRLARAWPWTGELVAVFTRLRSLPTA